MRSPGTTSRWATSSSAFSTEATPPSTFTFSKTSRAVSGTTSWKVSKPRLCTVAAPFCLPKPMASIFERPLSTSPWKSVCALTRLTGSTASARSAARLQWSGMPVAVLPSSTVSMLGSNGTSIDCAVTP